MASPVPVPPRSHRSGRDRHGRGLRGPLAPRSVPLARTRAQRFDDLVVAAAERLGRSWPAGVRRLGDLEIVVTDLPATGGDADAAPGRPVPLGAALPASGALPARVIVHRRPVEARATGRRELERLVRDVVAEQLAELLGVTPEDIDPDWTPP